MNKINIKKVAIVGGVHGNELTGVEIIDTIKKAPKHFQRESFQVIHLLGNPRAISARKRYINSDLNRCFKQEDLTNPSLNNYEQLRAKEIANQFKQEQVDFIIDIHSTTSEMGLTIILNSDDPFFIKLAAYLIHLKPSIKFLRYGHLGHLQHSPYLRSLCPLGLTVEVGSVAHNQINLELLKETEGLIASILDYLNAYRQNLTVPLADVVKRYKQIKVLDYPRNKQGHITGHLAPELRNYQLILPHKPIFRNSEGKNIYLPDQASYYPVFLAEKSYIEKGVAMGLATLDTFTLKDC